MLESPLAVRWYPQRVGQTPHRRSKPGGVSSFSELLADVGEESGGEKQKAPSSLNLTPGATTRMADSGATGFEPAIFGLTGQYVNRYTTPPIELYAKRYHSPRSLSRVIHSKKNCAAREL